MVSPWLQYEGYGMKLTNNVIYDVWGAGLGVSGGYSILIAHNTMFRCVCVFVWQRRGMMRITHALLSS